MKDIILKLVATNSGWIARRLIMYAAVATAIITTWLTAKGFSADISTAIATGIVSAVFGVIELTLSFIARKYKVPEADALRLNIDTVRKSAPLLVAGLCLLMLTSCAAVASFVASPLGQASLVTAEALGKQLAHATEAKVLEQIITKATAQIAALKAVDDANADLGKQLVRQSEITGLQAVIDTAQNQYVGLTGSRFVLPKNPVTSVTP